MEAVLFPIPRTLSKNKAAGGKVCTKCHRYIAYRYFSKDAYQPDGYQTRCKECAAEVQKASRQKMNYVTVVEKQCSNDGQFHPIEMFAKDRTKKDGHRSRCKDCDALARKLRNRSKLLKQPQSQLDITKAY